VRIPPHAISRRGVLPFNALCDSTGPMVKSAEDAAIMLNVFLGGSDYTRYLTQSFAGLRVGFLDPITWQPGSALVTPNEEYTKQYVRYFWQKHYFSLVANEIQMAEFNDMVNKMEAAGAIVHRNIILRRFNNDDSDVLNNVTCKTV
jgi:Asp-tRNA(Asn)/Glu-tRNA(Gln) amidotransferase A subunit family amidase